MAFQLLMVFSFSSGPRFSQRTKAKSKLEEESKTSDKQTSDGFYMVPFVS